MSVIPYLATVFGTISAFANFPQAYKIFKRKSAKDVSIITYGLVLIGTIVWLLYGIEINSFPLTFANAIGAFSVGLVVIGWFLYGGVVRKK
jgi:MtN3 and saliva related transmembrane protein